MNVKRQSEGLHFLFAEFLVLGSVRTELRFLVSGSKFSRCIECWRKMSLELEVFTSLSMIIDLAWLLKL